MLLATGVDNLTVDTSRDGFDVDFCRNVRISNCTVNSPGDDAICPKSSYALGYARSTDNVTISNNYVTGTYELGTVIDGTWKKLTDPGHPRQVVSSAALNPMVASAISPSAAMSSKAAKASL